MYFYAHKQQLQVQLWTASTGLVKGERIVLETLAAITSPEDASTSESQSYPVIWLTQNPLTLSSLPQGSRWVLWQDISSPKEIVSWDYPGIILQNEQALQSQLQKPLHSN